MFGAGLLLGSLATGVLFAPPDLANQPPPWDNPAWVASATSVLGAGRSQPKVAAATPPASAAKNAAAVQPAAAASQSMAAASQPMVASQSLAAASLPTTASQASAAASQPVAALAAVAAASQPATAATQPVAAAAQPLPVAQAATATTTSAAPDAGAKPQTVAKSEAAPKPEHKRKRPRRIESDDETRSPASDTIGTSSDSGPGFTTRSEERTAQRRRNDEASSDTIDSAGVMADHLPLSAEAPPHRDTLSGPPATIRVPPAGNETMGNGDSGAGTDPAQ
jgi:hypothetical protein